MSKLDQLKALGEAKRLARKVSERSDEAVETGTRSLASTSPAKRTSSGNRGGVVTRNRREGSEAISSVAGDTKHQGLHTPREFRKPLAKDADKTLMATKPWEAEGLSRRTWYRRRAEQKAK